MNEDLGDRRALTRRGSWDLFSGEEIELWLLKTALSCFHSGNVARERVRLRETHVVNPESYAHLYGLPLSPPCGLYIHNQAVPGPYNPGAFKVTSISDAAHTTMVGIRFIYMGLKLALFFNPIGRYYNMHEFTYRPTVLRLDSPQRAHHVVLTWPPARETRMVISRFVS